MAENCSTCGKQAVCVYGIRADETWACTEHDPMARPGFTTEPLPDGFQYRTLPAFVGATTETLAPMIRHHLNPGTVITNDGTP